MIEENVEIRTADGMADAVLLRPEGPERWPAVICLPDARGTRPVHLDLARRLAARGYVVLVPNVFYRTARPPVFDFEINFGDERTMKRLGELVGPLTPEAMERDGSAYVDFLARHAAVQPGPMGVVGYCFTGAMAMRTAAARPDAIGAAASFHGGHLVTDAPASPHRLLPRIEARLYFGHAIEDRGMPAEAIATLEAALAAWRGEYDSEIYEDARHGWTMADSPVYHERQSGRAFKALTDLLDESLRSSATAGR